jgi:Sodium:neurotransmitter symporter family
MFASVLPKGAHQRNGGLVTAKHALLNTHKRFMEGRCPRAARCLYTSAPALHDISCCAGRLFQKGALVFGSIHRRARGIGVMSAFCGFVIGARLSFVTCGMLAAFGMRSKACIGRALLHIECKHPRVILQCIPCRMNASRISRDSADLASVSRRQSCLLIQLRRYAATYYSSILAYVAYYFCASFAWPLPWATDTCAASDATCLNDPVRAQPIPASDKYFNDVIEADYGSYKRGVSKLMSGPLFGGVFAPKCMTLPGLCIGRASEPAILDTHIELQHIVALWPQTKLQGGKHPRHIWRAVQLLSSLGLSSTGQVPHSPRSDLRVAQHRMS